MTWLLTKKTLNLPSQISGIAQAVIDGDIVEMHDFDRWERGDFREDIFQVCVSVLQINDITLAVNDLYEALDG